MAELLLHSTKHDGSLHYRYAIEPVHESPHRLVAYRSPCLLESYRGSWTTTKQMLSLFWPARPYVLHVQWHGDWRPYSMYIDIAAGTGWRDGTVTYVDLDLDLIRPHGSDAVHLADEDEFEQHRVKWSYPDDLVKRCWSAVEEVRRLLARYDPPFDETLYAWRPGQALPA